MAKLTNYEVGERLGIDFTHASMLKTGRRLPSARLLVELWDKFNLSGDDLLGAYKAGRPAFATYMQEMVFTAPDEDPAPETPEPGK
ncbi:helix-turn-helix domain-containing protein [Microbispora rosea]|uniref:helix-turn-helix domain-containing protein n=1 Tax=Microbispora rosea TaxID=58117 RepID=UPI0037BCBF55